MNVGSPIDFKIKTDSSNYRIEVYRTGYYGGDGARKITTIQPSVTLPQHQPDCQEESSTGLVDCGNWAVSARWDVPADAVSGVYIALLEDPATGEASHIPFIVRDDSSTSDVVFQTADTTWQAYNTYGGTSMYAGGPAGRGYKLSYNRPFSTRGLAAGRDFYFSSEYATVRFLEQQGYDVSYISGVDADRHGDRIKNHKVYLSVGHDEYWSGAQRENVEAARDAGTHLQFLSGNEVYWRTRWETSNAGTATPYRTMVCYKETKANAKIDPSTEWTGTFRDPRFAPPSAGGGLPENGLVGTMYMVNFSDLALTVTRDEGRMRLWRNTPLATTSSPQTSLAPHTVGYESNEDLDNGARPPGLIRLSSTTGPTPDYLQDFGTITKPGTTTHHLTLYRARSGALVFSAGTIQWAWGLDDTHDSGYGSTPSDPQMRQAQVNLFADMGVQPRTLDSSITPATASTDTTAPTVSITSPAAGTEISGGSAVTVTGTATDTAGRVAGVEVSTDGGSTWHPATGTTSWTYSYIQQGTADGSGPMTIRARAIDDSANIGEITTRNANVSCPCSVYGQSTPATADSGDASAAELGLRFSPTTDGFTTGVRFYKSNANTGTHTGSLWTTTGVRLAQVTFANESAEGWQQATFSSAVPVSANQTYVVSYSTQAGHYAHQPWAFASAPLKADPLRVAGGYGAEPAGVYGAATTYPSQSWQNSSYFVDALFTTVDESPLTVSGALPINGATSVPTASVIRATYSKPVVSGSEGITVTDQNGATVAGTSTYASATRQITFTPTDPLESSVTYSVTVRGKDALDQQVSTGATWSFTTAKPASAAGVCPCTLFDDATTPGLLEAPEHDPVTLGVRFASDIDGQVTGIRFYKGPGNTGTHTATLWSAEGTALATGTFTGESTMGWQQLTFTEPVEISKDTEYYASYMAPRGAYSATLGDFAANNLSRAPLRVDRDSGAYSYSGGFPSSRSSSNYLVDVVFDRRPPSMAVAAQDPAPGALDVPRTSDVRVWFTSPLASGATLTVRQGSTSVPGNLATGNDGTRLTFTPTNQLPAGSELTVSLSGVISTDGISLPDRTWTFTTADAADTASPQTIFGPDLPATTDVAESSPIEVGTVFRPSVDGVITHLRFFKGTTANSGTHTGSIWSSDGTRLAAVTFANETPSGWQSARLSSPLAVTANTAYVVSYYAPRGHYSASSGYFGQSVTRGDLTAPATDNGRYGYGASGFPAYSFGATGYFVDVAFLPASALVMPKVVAQDPAPNATDVSRTGPVSVTFDAPAGTKAALALTIGGQPIAGTSERSADQKTVTFTPNSKLPASTKVTATITGGVNPAGMRMDPVTWTFETAKPTMVDVTLFGTRSPATASTFDLLGGTEVGTQFSVSAPGDVTAIRFYKGSSNRGIHEARLWTASGRELANVTFSNETSSGWQQASLSTPVTLTPGEQYVVSYYAPFGYYSRTSNFFTATPYTSGPLTATRTPNGRYRYGWWAGRFPSQIRTGTNYFVDIVYRYAAD